MGRKVGRETATLLVHVHEDASRLLGERLLQKARDRRKRARAEHDVRVRHVPSDERTVPLGDASAYGNDTPPSRRRRRAHHRRHLAVKARVGVFAHAACHEHDDIGVVWVVHLDATTTIEQPRHSLGVVEVHLAPEGPNEVGLADQA